MWQIDEDKVKDTFGAGYVDDNHYDETCNGTIVGHWQNFYMDWYIDETNMSTDELQAHVETILMNQGGFRREVHFKVTVEIEEEERYGVYVQLYDASGEEEFDTGIGIKWEFDEADEEYAQWVEDVQGYNNIVAHGLRLGRGW